MPFTTVLFSRKLECFDKLSKTPEFKEDFSSSLWVQTASGAHPASCKWVPGIFPRVNADGACC
jgi:hypothetical protein